ncbi:MAG: hypothetical protein R2701_02040 [Acidimicrobiales bacterium]
MLTTLVLAGSLVSSTTAGAAGETLTVVLTQNDGAAPFDADSAAGHDANDTNGIVRTNDNLTYNVELRVDGASSTNTTFTAALPKGVEMTQVPAFCTGAGSSLTPASLGAPVVPVTATSWTALNHQTLVCNVGNRTANSTFTYPVVAKVRPEVPNGTALTLETVTATSTDVTTPVESGPVTATVSARAQYDISKNAMALTENTGYINGNPGIITCPTASDPTRTCFTYAISMLISAPAGGKGSTPMASPLTFTDDLSPASLYPAGVTSDPDWIAAGSGALEKYGAILDQCARQEFAQPGGKIGLTSLYPAVGVLTAANSVRDSGTTTCTQPGGPGTPVSVSISNMDSSAYTYPNGTDPRSGAAIPADKAYVYSYSLRFRIPTAAVVDLGTESAAGGSWSLPWDNKYKDFAPTGIDGAVNLPAANPTFNDHRASTSVVQSIGQFDQWYSGIPGTLGNTPKAEFNPGNPSWE